MKPTGGFLRSPSINRRAVQPKVGSTGKNHRQFSVAAPMGRGCARRAAGVMEVGLGILLVYFSFGCDFAFVFPTGPALGPFASAPPGLTSADVALNGPALGPFASTPPGPTSTDAALNGPIPIFASAQPKHALAVIMATRTCVTLVTLRVVSIRVPPIYPRSGDAPDQPYQTIAIWAKVPHREWASRACCRTRVQGRLRANDRTVTRQPDEPPVQPKAGAKGRHHWRCYPSAPRGRGCVR